MKCKCGENVEADRQPGEPFDFAGGECENCGRPFSLWQQSEIDSLKEQLADLKAENALLRDDVLSALKQAWHKGYDAAPDDKCYSSKTHRSIDADAEEDAEDILKDLLLAALLEGK